VTSIKVISSTMGVSSPASVAEGTGYYRYKGDQPYRGPERSPMARAGDHLSRGKAARFAEYCRLRDEEHLSPAEAGERLGLAAKTGQAYERERLGKQQEEGQ
jgi:hypothetical protein